MTSQAFLTAYNTVPSQDHLEQLFFGSVASSYDYLSHDDKSRHISEQIDGAKQQLDFPPDDPAPVAGPYRNGVLDDVPKIIEDVPIGMRLLNTYQLGYFKDRYVTHT